MSVPPNIVTECIYPPIPIRKFDWVAYFDGQEEGLSGYGETKQAAIDNLLNQYEGEENADA